MRTRAGALGPASAGSLIAQIVELNEYGWPDEDADGEIWAWTWLYLLAASSGCWVGLWGLFGLAWRPPLHLGILALVVALGFEIGANLVQADYVAQLDRSWSFADQLGWYGDRITFQADGLAGDGETTGFLIALPLVTAWLPIAAWFAVLVSGAGRKVRPAPSSAARISPAATSSPATSSPATSSPATRSPATNSPATNSPSTSSRRRTIHPYRRRTTRPSRLSSRRRCTSRPGPARARPLEGRAAGAARRAARRPLPKPPDQQETQPYRTPTEGP